MFYFQALLEITDAVAGVAAPVIGTEIFAVGLHAFIIFSKDCICQHLIEVFFDVNIAL